MLAMVLVLLGYLALSARRLSGPTLGGWSPIALVTGRAALHAVLGVLPGRRVVGALAGGWRRAGRRGACDARGCSSCALAVGGLLFVPWLPTFVYQMQHTGTPWDTPTSPPTNTALGIVDFAGGTMHRGLDARAAARAARADRVRRAGPSTWTHADDRPAHASPGVRWEWLVGVATLMVGLTLSFVAGSGFQSRYAAVMYPVCSRSQSRSASCASGRRLRVGVLAFVVVLGFVGGVATSSPTARRRRRSRSQIVTVSRARRRRRVLPGPARAGRVRGSSMLAA